MSFVDWEIEGVEFAPVERGRYGDVRLDGLDWGMLSLSIEPGNRTASLRVAGLGESTATPIINRKTGATQRARVWSTHGVVR